jgi:hypothetical protein
MASSPRRVLCAQKLRPRSEAVRVAGVWPCRAAAQEVGGPDRAVTGRQATS